MKYRGLGSTGLTVSVVGIGTWQLSGEWGQHFTHQEVDRLLGRAGEPGVNLVDTAECYGDHLAEALVGAAIRQRRDDWVIATKFGHRFHPEASQQEGWSPVSVRSDHWTPTEVIGQLEASLRALGTDHVDLDQAHSGPDEVIDHGGLWEALRQQVAKGTVRHLGLSLSGGDLDQARRARQLGAVVVQVGYNRLDRTGEGGFVQACLDQDLGVMAREPLANGYLSGKYRPGGASPLVATGAPAATGPRSSASSRWWRRSDGPRCPRGWPWPSEPSPGACSTRPSAVSWPAPDRSNRWSPTPTRPT
jgi:aryl-alcohol dehydrogenase-like predicted oxidoreductase